MNALPRSIFAVLAVALCSCGSNVIDTDPTCEDGDPECTNPPPACGSTSECSESEACTSVGCVSLQQGHCQEVYPGDSTFHRDGVFFIGVSAPLTGFDGLLGQSIVDAAKLAVDDFNKDGGILGETPMVLVVCDDEGEAEVAHENGQTLADLGIPAMIGPTFSGQVLQTADSAVEEDTVSRGVLLMSTAATSPLITSISDNDLVYRTSPSDVVQGLALSSYFNELEAIVKARGGVQRSDITVAVLYSESAYGDLLSDVIRTTLVFNDEPATSQQGTSFLRQSYGDPAGIDATIIDNAIASQPDAIFLIGTSETAEILATIEQEWAGADEDRPFYILADGGLTQELAEAARSVGAQSRVRGSVPGSSGPEFQAFAGSFFDRFPSGMSSPEIFGAAGAYDAIHLFAYSALTLGDQPPTGSALAGGISRLVSGTRAFVGRADIGFISAVLTNGDSVDLEGASGPLDFDLMTGDATSDIQIWCVPSAGAPVRSNTFWASKTGAMAGGDPGEQLFTCPFQ